MFCFVLAINVQNKIFEWSLPLCDIMDKSDYQVLLCWPWWKIHVCHITHSQVNHKFLFLGLGIQNKPVPTPPDVAQDLQIKQEPESVVEEELAIKQESYCSWECKLEDKGALSLAPKPEAPLAAQCGKEERLKFVEWYSCWIFF